MPRPAWSHLQAIPPLATSWLPRSVTTRQPRVGKKGKGRTAAYRSGPRSTTSWLQPLHAVYAAHTSGQLTSKMKRTCCVPTAMSPLFGRSVLQVAMRAPTAAAVWQALPPVLAAAHPHSTSGLIWGSRMSKVG